MSSQHHLRSQYSPLWSATKAGAFMDALDQANRAERRQGRVTETPASPAPLSRRRPVLQHFVLGLTPQRVAAGLAAIAISGLTVAGFVA